MAQWTPPPSIDQSAFFERDTTIEAAGVVVPGTLTLPARPSGRGVVLLSGGGPHDRDETIGPNKPLKDLAWGLAMHGVAVLRFDKVTANDPEAMTAAGHTMTAEYVPHGVAAVRELSKHVDRVFLVGHSMGGKVAPKVAAVEPLVAGVVIMAGDTEPMHRSAVRVIRYLREAEPAAVPPELVALFERQADAVEFATADTPSEDLPFGMPPSFWFDQRSYDPVATAGALGRPILILQGGRDYQVTTVDDLPAWRAGVPDATIIVLEEDDHMFFRGEGRSTMADYLKPGHLDPAVVEVIVDWLP